MSAGSISTRLLSGFDDSSLDGETWEQLLASGESDVVFLTREWLSAWWECFGRGELLLIIAERNGKIVALAPLFADTQMVYFVGSGGSDYLDFIGDTSESDIVDALLTKAMESVSGFEGFVFYHVPERSRTRARLLDAGDRLGLRYVNEGGMMAPALDLTDEKAAREVTEKKSLIRDEKALVRDGEMVVTHFTDGRDIMTQLPALFAQHRERWAQTTSPSEFLDDAQQRFYQLVCTNAADTGWLRFARLEWRGEAISHHFGFCYRGTFLYYKPTYAIERSKQSPGRVLLRHLLLRAIAEGAHTFDFGLGDEGFKSRFATRFDHVGNHAFYKHAGMPA